MQWYWQLSTLAVLTLAGWIWSSCTTVERAVVTPTQIAGAEYVGNSTCSHCHTDLVDQFPETPHARIRFQAPNEVGNVGCELCHGPGSKHVNSGGNWKPTIVNPGRKPEACFQCHQGVEAAFQLPYHHPVLEDQMSCVDCHDPHSKQIHNTRGGLAMAQRNQTCAQCHEEQTQPFVFEHEALREGCMVCHQPHGSINRKLLRQADNNLCLRCHAQVQDAASDPGRLVIGKVDHTFFVQQGACWSCHTSIHGSNVNPRMRY